MKATFMKGKHSMLTHILGRVLWCYHLHVVVIPRVTSSLVSQIMKDTILSFIAYCLRSVGKLSLLPLIYALVGMWM
jgi:uncharacterized membrane protein